MDSDCRRSRCSYAPLHPTKEALVALPCLALPCLALPCLALRSCLLQYCDDASDPKPRLKRCHLRRLPSAKVESFDDDAGPTDDLIGSVKISLQDIGLESDGTPLECWMVLGKEGQSKFHHSRKLHSAV